MGVFGIKFPSLEAFLEFHYCSFTLTLLGFLRVEDKGLKEKIIISKMSLNLKLNTVI